MRRGGLPGPPCFPSGRRNTKLAIKHNSFLADQSKIDDGVWIEIPDAPDGDGGVLELYVRGWSYGPYQAASSILTGVYVRKYGSAETAPQDIRNRDLCRNIAKYLLLGWRGSNGGEGIDVPFSAQLAEELLNAPGDFSRHVIYAISQVQRTELEFTTDAAKNSARSSGGSLKAAAQQPTGSPT